MKKEIRKRALAMAMAAAAWGGGCDKHYSAPLPDPIPVELEDTISIAALKALYPGNPLTIRDDLKIKGKVVSSDMSGNLYNCLYIQDGHSAIQVRIGRSALYTCYPVGMILSVRLKEMTLGAYGTMLSIGAGPVRNVGGGISSENSVLAPDFWIESALVRGPVVAMTGADTTRIEAISERIERNTGRLVRVKGRFYKNPALDTWASAGEAGLHYLYFGTNPVRSHITIRTGSSASFAARPVTHLEGLEIYATGILTVFNGNWQLVILSERDVVEVRD